MPKLVKYGIILCVILVIGFAGYAIYHKSQTNSQFAAEVDRHLTDEDRQIFQKRVSDGQDQLQSAQSDDDKFNIYMQLGFNQSALGNLADAEDAFNQAIKLKPDDYRGYAALYQVQSDRGNYPAAEASIKTAIDKNPTGVDLWKNYGQFESEKMHISSDQVSAIYADALNKTNNNIDMVTFYASWLRDSGNLQASKEYWQKAIEINPNGKKTYQAEIDSIDKLMKSQ